MRAGPRDCKAVCRKARAETGTDPYDNRLQQRVPANDTGGVALAPAAAADAAVASAAALSGPKALRCDLCNVCPPALSPAAVTSSIGLARSSAVRCNNPTCCRNGAPQPGRSVLRLLGP